MPPRGNRDDMPPAPGRLSCVCGKVRGEERVCKPSPRLLRKGCCPPPPARLAWHENVATELAPSPPPLLSPRSSERMESRTGSSSAHNSTAGKTQRGRGQRGNPRTAWEPRRGRRRGTPARRGPLLLASRRAVTQRFSKVNFPQKSAFSSRRNKGGKDVGGSEQSWTTRPAHVTRRPAGERTGGRRIA